MKKKIFTKKSVALGCSIVIMVLVFAAIYFGRLAVPDNPISDIDEIKSEIKTSNTNPDSKNNSEETSSPSSENAVTITDIPLQTLIPTPEPTKLPEEPKSENEGSKPENEEPKLNEKESKADNKNPDIIKLTEQKDSVKKADYDGYFNTNIKDNEITNEKLLKLVITQKKHNLEILDIDIKLNGIKMKNSQGKLNLAEGKNEIAITIQYKTKDGSILNIKKTYHVTYQSENIVVLTDLVDGTVVTEADFTFIASASYQKEDIPILVYINDSIVSKEDKNYKVVLQPGENTIRLNVRVDEKEVSDVYKIIYEKQSIKYTFTTDLYNKEVNSPYFSFYVREDREVNSGFTVSLNDEKIISVSEQYEVVLKVGINRIKLAVWDTGDKYQETYEIKYVPIVFTEDNTNGDTGTIPTHPTIPTNTPAPTNAPIPTSTPIPTVTPEPTKEPEKHLPILVTDLEDGSTITGTTLSFYIKPVDYKGDRIRASGVVVECNGQTIPQVWDDSTKTSYRMELISGANSIIITLTDLELNTSSYLFTIYCNSIEQGESLGFVTFSVEATTIGQGYIIPPTQVEIFQGMNAVSILADLLSQYGYAYKHTGSIGTGFYLSHILGVNIVSNPMVNEELEEHLKNTDGIGYDIEKYNSNSLGEFDFTTGSGWMYSVNSEYPNYGFSDCFPHDGDIIRVRFTLYMGKDIMGGYAMGDGNDDNWGDW